MSDHILSQKHIDRFFLHVDAEASISPDAETKIGAVLINPATKDIIATGLNGFVRGALDDALPKTRPAKYPYMVHAEINLLCNAAKHGKRTEGGVLFLSQTSCTNCTRAIFQAGISTYYFKSFYRDFDTSSKMDDMVQFIRTFPTATKPGLMLLSTPGLPHPLQV